MTRKRIAEIIAELQAIEIRELETTNDADTRRALERAASWLANITAPLAETERQRYATDIAWGDADAILDDTFESQHEWLSDMITAMATDADMRVELADFDRDNDAEFDKDEAS